MIRLIIEELWAGDVFTGFGNILAAEVINNGKRLTAFRFGQDGRETYYDHEGRSLRKVLSRSPLSYRRISSHYSKNRFHPVLRIYRPHLGVDYAAARGTPVSSTGNGTIVFSGYKGQNGKMVRIRHKNAFETYYGHLSRIPKHIRKGARVSQGDIIGYVGSTGLSTGPHLDYRVKKNGRFVNPLTLDLPDGSPVPESSQQEFLRKTGALSSRLVALTRPFVANRGRENTSI